MKTVLLIEDDKDIAMSLGIRLRDKGYQLAMASDAISAISQARSSNPDVAVIDINLPGGDGFVVAERLRKLLETSTTPLIFMTASKAAGLKERAQTLGSVAFLEKPFDSTKLVNVIETSINGDVMNQPAEVVA